MEGIKIEVINPGKNFKVAIKFFYFYPQPQSNDDVIGPLIRMGLEAYNNAIKNPNTMNQLGEAAGKIAASLQGVNLSEVIKPAVDAFTRCNNPNQPCNAA